jgi:glycosyltransferase involved in cell wall biosynthesis
MLLVNTSNAEGFSNTFIEAWKEGVPVLSFYVNPDNIITEKKLGSVSNSLKENAIFIENIFCNNKLWNEYSKNCMNFVRENFDIKKNVDNLESIFNLEAR